MSLWCAGAVGELFKESQSSSLTHRKLAVQLRNIHASCIERGQTAAFEQLIHQLVLKVLVVRKAEPAGDRVVAFLAAYAKQILPNVKRNGSAQGDVSMASLNDTSTGSVDGVDAVDAAVDVSAINYDEDDEYFSFLENLLRFIAPGLKAADRNVRYRASQLMASTLKYAVAIDRDLAQALADEAVQRLKDRDASVRAQAVAVVIALLDPSEPERYEASMLHIKQVLRYDDSPEVRRAALLKMPRQKRYHAWLIERAQDTNAINRRMVYTRVMRGIGDFRKVRMSLRENLLRGLKDRDASVRGAAVDMVLDMWYENADGNLLSILCRLDVINNPDVARQAVDIFFEYRPQVLTESMVFSDEFWADLTPDSTFIVRCFNDYCQSHDLGDLAYSRLPTLSQMAELVRSYWDRHLVAASDVPQPDNTEFELIVEQLLSIAVTYDFGDETGRTRMLVQLERILLDPIMPSYNIVARVLECYRKALTSDSDFLLKVAELMDEADGLDSADDSNILARELLQQAIVDAALGNLSYPCEDTGILKTLWRRVSIALTAEDTDIFMRGVRCLGQLCTLNKALADENFEDLLAQYYIPSDGEELLEGTAQSNAICIKAVCDVLLSHRVNPDFARTAVEIIHAGSKCSDFPELQSVAIQAYTKLLLSGLLSDETVLVELMVEYYTTSSQEIEQCLSFFLPVYARTSPENQQRLAQGFATVFEQVMAAKNDEDAGDAPAIDLLAEPGLDLSTRLPGAAQVINQFVEWCDPDRLSPPEKTNAHVVLARGMLKFLSPDVRRSIFSALPRLNIYPASVSEGEQLQALAPPLETLDKTSQAHLEQFKRMVAEAINAGSGIVDLVGSDSAADSDDADSANSDADDAADANESGANESHASESNANKSADAADAAENPGIKQEREMVDTPFEVVDMDGVEVVDLASPP